MNIIPISSEIISGLCTRFDTIRPLCRSFARNSQKIRATINALVNCKTATAVITPEGIEVINFSASGMPRKIVLPNMAVRKIVSRVFFENGRRCTRKAQIIPKNTITSEAWTTAQSGAILSIFKLTKL